MNINLMPKDKKDKKDKKEIKVKPQRNIGWVGIVIGILCFFSIGLLYFNHLWQQIRLNETILQELNTDIRDQSEVYRQVQNIEAKLRQLSTRNELQKIIYASYLPPLNVLETIIQLKPDLIWFEKIEFNSMEGSFILTGGAVDYKVFAGFIGKLEQDKNSFTQVKPENAMTTRNETGQEYVQFKITGILTKRSATNEQNR